MKYLPSVSLPFHSKWCHSVSGPCQVGLRYALDIFPTQFSKLCESAAFTMSFLCFPTVNTPKCLSTPHPGFKPHLLPQPIVIKFLVSNSTTCFLHSSWTLFSHSLCILHRCGQISPICSLQPNSHFSFSKLSPTWNLLRHYR